MKEKEYLETKKLLEEEYDTTNPSNKAIVKGVLKEMMMLIYMGTFLCYFIWSIFKALFVANYKGFGTDLWVLALLVFVFFVTVAIKVKLEKKSIKDFQSFKI